MQLVHVETFVAILEEGSLAEAALRLDVSPSTVTERLQALERELGCRLVDRSRSGVAPTAAGLRVRANATTMIELWTQIRREASLAADVTDTCVFACHVDAWVGAGDRLMSAIRTAAPHLAITVRTGSEREVLGWQRSGLADVALLHDADAPAGHERHRLAEDRLILVSDRPDTPLRFDPGYVFVDLGEAFVRAHAAAYTDASLAFVTFDDASTAVEHIANHGGSAYVPERLAADRLASRTLHHLAEAPEFGRGLDLVVAPDAAPRFTWLQGVLDEVRAGATDPAGAGVRPRAPRG